MSLLIRPFRALLAEALAIGLLVVLLGLPLANVNAPPETAARATTPVRTEAPTQPTWPLGPPSNEPVQGQLGHAASAAGDLMERELDRILAPFVAVRSAMNQ